MDSAFFLVLPPSSSLQTSKLHSTTLLRCTALHRTTLLRCTALSITESLHCTALSISSHKEIFDGLGCMDHAGSWWMKVNRCQRWTFSNLRGWHCLKPEVDIVESQGWTFSIIGGWHCPKSKIVIFLSQMWQLFKVRGG